jgi:hypothetical protein
LLKKTITYKNIFTDEEVTEDFYFHLSKADLVKMEADVHSLKYKAKDGNEYTGLQAHFAKISDTENAKDAVDEFDALLRRSYLKRVNDKPVKSPEIWAEFEGSEAYSELLFELATDAVKAAEFFAAMFPGDFTAELERISAEVEARQSTDSPAQGGSAQTEVPALEKANTALEGEEPTLETLQERRRHLLENATPENPVTITRAEMVEMEEGTLQSGLASGRFKLS